MYSVMSHILSFFLSFFLSFSERKTGAAQCHGHPEQLVPPTTIPSLISFDFNCLQHSAPQCNTAQHNAIHHPTMQYTTPRRTTAQHTARQFNILQHTTPRCNTMQRSAPYRRRRSAASVILTSTACRYDTASSCTSARLLASTRRSTPLKAAA